MIEGTGGALRAGECDHCGTLNRLNEQGLCSACAVLPVCTFHSYRISAARCLHCRTPYCRDCLENGLCGRCFELAVEQRPDFHSLEPLFEPALEAPRAPSSLRAPILVAIALFMAVFLGARYGYDQFGPPASERSCVERLEATVDACQSFRVNTGAPPKDAAALNAFMVRRLPHPPKVVPDTANPGPNLVLFRVRGHRFELRATDDGGHLYSRDGRVVVVTGS